MAAEIDNNANQHKNQNGHTNHDNDDDEPTTKATTIQISDTKCGCGPCKPRWLQRIVCPLLFAVHAAVLIALGGIQGTYFLGILTTIERRFQLSSSESSALSIVNDVVSLSLIVFVSYYGHRAHRPRWIASGLLMVAAGLLVCVLPHLLSDPLDPQSVIEGGFAAKTKDTPAMASGVCESSMLSTPIMLSNSNQMILASNDSSTVDECEGRTSNKLASVKWLIIGQIIIGAGSTPVWPLAFSYIDDAVEKHKLTTFTGESS